MVWSLSPAGLDQHGWRRCNKCLGLFSAMVPVSKCPEDGGNHTGGGHYSLERAPDALDEDAFRHCKNQLDWRRCNKCLGLFFGGNPGSKCPAGGEHSKTGDYGFDAITIQWCSR